MATPQNNPTPQQPAQPAPVAAPQSAPAPAPKPVAPLAQTPAPATAAAQPAKPAAAQPATPPKPGTPLPKDQTKSNKRLVVGCLTAFGCSLFLFIGVLFAFLAFGDPGSNPMFSFLGSSPGAIINALLNIVDMIFLVLVFAAFIFVIIGVFKISTARKDDKEAKRGGTMFTVASLAILVLFIVVWIFAHFFLAQKRTPVVTSADITTEPTPTIGLTAPITIKFDASKARVNKTQFSILSYDWDFGDKSEAKGNPQTHTFTELGNFKVTLKITLKEKSTGKDSTKEFTHDVTIQNVTAEVKIKADKTKGVAPLTVNFDGSDSKSPNGEITAYAWDLNGDDVYDDGTETTAQKTFDKVGAFKVGLRVTDSLGAFATGSIEIETTVPDTPIAAIAVEGVEGANLEINKPYIFSGASSTSPTGSVEKYSWTFGDGGKAETRTSTHIFKTAGEYDVTLKITDTNKKTAETITRFTVGTPESPPLASIKTTPAASANNTVAGQAPFDVLFDASGSQDPNNNIVEYVWDFDGDGKTDDANPTTSHKFMTAGNYNVSLTVTDAANLSTKAQIVVQVQATGLKADIAADPIAGVVSLTVKFDASGSSYSEGKIVGFEWDFGDGTSPRMDTSKVSHQYTAIGNFTAKVSAVTSDGKRAEAQIPINVRPVPLKACFEPSVSSGKAPLEIEFDPTCSTGTVTRYNWNFANLGRSTDRKTKFTFKDAGEYEVSLEVADAQNTVDTFTNKITVEAK